MGPRAKCSIQRKITVPESRRFLLHWMEDVKTDESVGTGNSLIGGYHWRTTCYEHMLLQVGVGGYALR